MSHWSTIALLALVMASVAGCSGPQYPRASSAAPAAGQAADFAVSPQEDFQASDPAPSPVVAVETAPASSTGSDTSAAASSVSTGQPSRLTASQQSALVSGTPTYAAIRSGDIIEVRFYGDTALESQRYDLGVGDVLAVDVFGFPELSRERVVVLPDGFVSAPLVGSVRAAGKNVDEISFKITQRLEEEHILDPQVTVAVVETDRRRDALLGGAGESAQQSVRIAVSEAGYLNLPYVAPLAVVGRSLAEIQDLVRDAYAQEFGGRVEVTANLLERSIPVVFVMGEVVNPAQVELTGPLNPLMAIAASGGFTVRAEPAEVRVVRIRSDGNYQQYAFNMAAGLDGTSNAGANFRLQPHDVVVVPPSGIADANTWVDQWIRQMIPISIGVSPV